MTYQNAVASSCSSCKAKKDKSNYWIVGGGELCWLLDFLLTHGAARPLCVSLVNPVPPAQVLTMV